MIKILVTSSTGLTGRAVVKALSQCGASVRAMVHSDSRREDMLALGATETITASIESKEDLRKAMSGIDTIFYICPTAHPEEGKIGCMAVDIAVETGVGRFIYQSVHNSIEPQLPHHRQKLMVEQHLLESSLKYTILRPAAFMQNIPINTPQLLEQHIFSQRFFTQANSSNCINLIDVHDYAAIAAKICVNPGYDYGSFDLCGPCNLSAADMLAALSNAIGHAVTLHYITDEDFIATAKKRGMPESKTETLLAMFRAYNRYGFTGNSFIAKSILGRCPNSFSQYLSSALPH